jgi:hypothetical protein
MDIPRDVLPKAARIAYLVLLVEKRGPGKPRKKEFDTAEIASRLGVTQRSIQRDLHFAHQVREIMAKFPMK